MEERGKQLSGRISPKRVAAVVVKGLAACGYVLFGTILCVSCAGLPLVSGLFTGVAVGSRFGISAGVVTTVIVFYTVARKRVLRGRRGCAVANSGGDCNRVARARP